MNREEIIRSIRAVSRRCRGPLTLAGAMTVRELLERGDLEMAGRADAANRLGCGYDVNELIINGPWDGQQHCVRCPGCGRMIRYRAPRV